MRNMIKRVKEALSCVAEFERQKNALRAVSTSGKMADRILIICVRHRISFQGAIDLLVEGFDVEQVRLAGHLSDLGIWGCDLKNVLVSAATDPAQIEKRYSEVYASAVHRMRGEGSGVSPHPGNNS